MNLNKILQSEKTVHFSGEWNGELVEWDAKEKALTPKVLQSFADVKANPIGMANGLGDILTDWTIFIEEKGDFPPTAENLSIVPLDFLTWVLEKISETWQGGKPQKASRNISAG